MPNLDGGKFLREWWYVPGCNPGPLGYPHSFWALRLRIELGRNLPDVRR